MAKEGLTHDRMKKMVVKMLRVRMFEEKIDELFVKG
jgi:TPP-dependent pyruvate/acetoin dehydrogenase alpha subunit